MDASLVEVDIDKIAVGQTATVRFDALAGKTFQAQVVRIAPEATVYRGDQVYKVTLALPDAARGGVRWGMTAKVSIPVNR
jgi:multidrug resistance efflux pump